MSVAVASTTCPIGPFSVAVDAGGRLVAASFETPGFSLAGWLERRGMRAAKDDGRCEGPLSQVREFFARERKQFELPLAPAGTEFQRLVWAELVRIPFGETRSYGQIAANVGGPKTVRAVGRANGANPIALIVPCHRVIGADGSLTGYAGGLEVKKFLLDFERGQATLG